MITRIFIRNLACFDNWESPELPDVVLIDGGNGVGKSSLQDVLKHLVGSGHDPDILRGGADAGECVVTFSDGNEARVRTTAKTTERSWKAKDGKRWINSRELVDKIAAAIDYDPLSFLKLKPIEQVQKLLQVSDVRASDDEIIEAIGEAHQEAAESPLRPGLSGLEALDIIYDTVYKARTVLNTGAKELESHAKQLLAAPGADASRDWSAEADGWSAQLLSIESSEQKEMEAIGAEVQGVRERAAKVIEDARLLAESMIESARSEANKKAMEVNARNRPKRQQLTSELATAKRNAEIQQQAKGTRLASQKAMEEAEVKKNRSAVLSASLERIQALKLKLAERLPIPGVTVSEGKIVREEGGALVPLSRWNTASKCQFCLKLAVINAREAGFVCVDNIEHFEKANREALYAAARKYAKQFNIQFLFGKVRDEGGQMAIGEPGQ